VSSVGGGIATSLVNDEEIKMNSVLKDAAIGGIAGGLGQAIGKGGNLLTK
jgi:hypothetical protein